MNFEHSVKNTNILVIRQVKELAELIGFETRNKYSIQTSDGTQIAFAAEQQKGLFGFLGRQFLGHWRPFDIAVFDQNRRELFRAAHPFRIIFDKLQVRFTDGAPIGSLQQRFAIFTKRFDCIDRTNQVAMKMSSPLFRIWTFPFYRRGEEVASISKKWGGVLKEVFTDTDTFQIEYKSADLSFEDRLLILAAGLFVDIIYFEYKARR